FIPIMLCLFTLPVFADDTPSGFLSDYERLGKEGSIRARYLGYTAEDADAIKTPAVYVAPVGRFPLAAQFGDSDDALVSSVLTYTQQQLRSQLAVRTRVLDDPSSADVSLEVALTAMGPETEGKTPLDLVPFRLITGTAKNVAMGKVLEATAVFEMRVSQVGSSKILRESIHHLVGDSIGRNDNEETRMSLDALKPALDKWVALVVDQVAPKS
ncbi:MAG TPA: DUF3313 family protein, partial [Kineobactrum sp.]